MLWDVLTTVKSSFESQLTLVGHWCRISGNGGEEDDAHFERGRVKKAWTGYLCGWIAAYWYISGVPSKMSSRSGRREWIAAGYLGEGMPVHA